MVTIQQVRQANRTWFGDGNQEFFGDESYQILHSELTGKPYLVRSTSGWSDMFGGKRTLCWRLNPLDEILKIRPLVDIVFVSLQEVEMWLGDN